MKLAKLSLAAIVVAGLTSSSFAADNLADAFKNGKVSGELKAYYFSNKDDVGDKDSIFTTGVLLNYKTDTLYGFGLNLTAQGSSSPFADHGAKDDYKYSMYGPGAQISEAYLSYTLGKTTALVGRMFLDTPLVASSGSRVIKDAFEGAAIINTDLPNTTLIAGYVQKGQDRTNYNDGIGKFTKYFATGSLSIGQLPVEAEDGAYTLAIINKSITGLTLTAAYANAFDIAQLAYIEALYEGKASELGYTLGAQYYYNKIDSSLSVGIDDTISSYAFKAGLSYKGINGTVAYSQTSDDNVLLGELVSGLGNGADLLYTDAVISSPGYVRDTKAYLVDINYDVTAAANIGARYVQADYDVTNEKASFTSIYGSYKFDGALKGFKLGAEFEDKGKDASGNDLWVKANYKF
ncbi:OprD family outer membrane porin [Sulfurospirillum sp. UCH001]|uniref:OprD family outer membrane porin n=1 Tax=Sulfurospirillum sp. UCH001 TaxID=1581011 RepID=UPI00082F60DC|nr:OprD family outer membrane porin [Sulfurospirillum sp. UCH001]